MNCTTCLYCEKKSSKLICRRYPPFEIRLVVRPDDWCGEYKQLLDVKQEKKKKDDVRSLAPVGGQG